MAVLGKITRAKEVSIENFIKLEDIPILAVDAGSDEGCLLNVDIIIAIAELDRVLGPSRLVRWRGRKSFPKSCR